MVVVLHAQHWCSLLLVSPPACHSKGSVCLWASSRAVNAVNAFAGLRGCAGHGEEGRGQLEGAGVCGSRQGVFGVLRICSKTKQQNPV